MRLGCGHVKQRGEPLHGFLGVRHPLAKPALDHALIALPVLGITQQNVDERFGPLQIPLPVGFDRCQNGRGHCIPIARGKAGEKLSTGEYAKKGLQD